MGKEVRGVSCAPIVALAVVVSACGAGSWDSSGSLPRVASNREASAGSDVGLCIAAGPEMPGEGALVEFANQSFGSGDRMPPTSYRCATYRSFVVARIIDADPGSFIMSISVYGDQDGNSPNRGLQCDQYTPPVDEFETRLDVFDRWSPPRRCSGKDFEAHRFADSRGTVESNVNVGSWLGDRPSPAPSGQPAASSARRARSVGRLRWPHWLSYGVGSRWSGAFVLAAGRWVRDGSASSHEIGGGRSRGSGVDGLVLGRSGGSILGSGRA